MMTVQPHPEATKSLRGQVKEP